MLNRYTVSWGSGKGGVGTSQYAVHSRSRAVVGSVGVTGVKLKTDGVFSVVADMWC